MTLFFPSFFDRPKNIKFADQEPDEKIELFLRQHWFTNLSWVVLSLVAFLLPPLLVNLDIWLGTNYLLQIPLSVILGGIVVWYLLLTAYVLEHFIYWYFNIYIITNQHIVDVDFISLLYREITEIELKDIESVNSKMSGVAKSLFNFGDVKIETAAKGQAVNLADIPHPDFVADRVEDLRAVKKEGEGE